MRRGTALFLAFFVALPALLFVGAMFTADYALLLVVLALVFLTMGFTLGVAMPDE